MRTHLALLHQTLQEKPLKQWGKTDGRVHDDFPSDARGDASPRASVPVRRSGTTECRQRGHDRGTHLAAVADAQVFLGTIPVNQSPRGESVPEMPHTALRQNTERGKCRTGAYKP